MSDLISRQAAIELADTLKDDLPDDERIADAVIAHNEGVLEYQTKLSLLPSAEPKIDDENELKFYYVESLDDYWIGRRLDNFYYANWHDRLGFVWSHSEYLPWGEHIVDETTLWKEHTYPSEPIEIPFTEWIVGFVKKYFAEPKIGRWIEMVDADPMTGEPYVCGVYCSECGERIGCESNFCPNCGADMRGKE